MPKTDFQVPDSVKDDETDVVGTPEGDNEFAPDEPLGQVPNGAEQLPRGGDPATREDLRPYEGIRTGSHLLERQEAEDKAKSEWLRGTTKEAFAAFDRGEGISLSSAEDIDALVNSAIVEGKAARHTIRA